MLVFFVIFLIGFFRHRRRIRPYTKYALIPAVVLILIEASIVLLVPSTLETLGIPGLVCADLVVFARILIFGAVGMFCATSLGYKPIPFVRGLLTRRSHLFAGLSNGFRVWTPVCVIGAVVYSCVLFTLVPVHISEAMRAMLESSTASASPAMEPSVTAGLVMFEFALIEEITFRLGIQNYLAYVLKLRGNNYVVAILLTTVLWSIAHVNTLEPTWVKIAQVFPLGIVLGLLFRRYGVGVCIAVHSLFNLVMMFLASRLIEAP